MSAGFEWSGYASQPLSGVAEALDAAGIDCAVGQEDGREYGAVIQPRWWESNEAPSQ